MGASPVPPYNPLAVIYDVVLGGLALYEAYQVTNNYISKSPIASNTPQIPTSKKSSSKTASKTAQKAALGDYALGISTLLATGATTLSDTLSSGKKEVESFSNAQVQKTSELLVPSSSSPLLTNQVFIKDSIDKLIDSINANALITASVFGMLSPTLSAIGSSLTAISATLIEVADNYSRELNNTGDIPYINQDDYYRMLSHSDMSAEDIASLRSQEDSIIDSLLSQNSTYEQIKSTLQSWRSNTVPSGGQSAIEKEMSGLSRSPTVNSSGQSSSSVPVKLELPNVEKWAASAFAVNEAVTPDMFRRNVHSQVAKNEYLTASVDIKDLDGNILANMKPMEAHTAKNITEARLRTDMNNFELDEGDFDISLLDGLDISSLFSFEKKSARLMDLNG